FCDKCASVGQKLHVSISCQLSQCFSNRRTTHADLLRNLLLPQMEFRAEFAPEDTISDGLVGLDCRFCHSARSLNKGLVAKPSRSRLSIGHWIDPEPINPDRGRS